MQSFRPSTQALANIAQGTYGSHCISYCTYSDELVSEDQCTALVFVQHLL